MVRELVQQELERIRSERGDERFERGHFPAATRLFEELVASDSLEEFLTLKAYQCLD
jgi:malate synthase